ncbi:MAG TPA: MASE1 domain-containing protein [Gemmatimonadales bacterium]|nr:MASE1 domain-containing protein [Gemmatimonadales bacterium]
MTQAGRTMRAGLLVAAAYYVAARVGLTLTIHPYPVSILWVPNAILLAALLLTPVRSWFFMLLAALPAHLAAELPGGVPLPMVLSWFVSNSTEALIGAGCARYFIGEPLRFDRFRHVAVYVALAAFLGAFASSFLDAGLVAINRWGAAGFWENWRVRFFSNVLAALIVVPAIVIWGTGGVARLRAGLTTRLVEGSLLGLSLILVCVWVFLDGAAGPAAMPALVFAPLSVLLWSAVRFGTGGTSASLLLVALLAIGGAMLGRGPFVSVSPADRVLALQLYLIAMCVPLLGLAAFVEERVQAEDVLRETHQARSELVHLSRAAILGELAGALAHELNQPLAAILANARAGQRILERDTIDVKEVREILDDIAGDDRRAGEVIRRLHALLKKGDLQRRPLDLNEVVSDALELMHSDLIQRSVSVDAHLAPELPMVLADPVQLQQVLLNLFLNGCEAMGEREHHDRRLTIATTQQAGGYVRIAIADRGTGIPDDKLDRVFEPFFSSKAEGLGLGLSICRSIVRAHGGRLWAANNPNGGATFYVELDGGGVGAGLP